MSKTEATVQKYMTYQPHFIEAGELLSEAIKIMKDNNIRHLPVMEDGKIFGILSDRDAKMATSLVGTDPEKMFVREVCHTSPYQTSPETQLHEVADEMAESHYGCAIVVQNHKLVGIFTTVDACRALSEVLQQRFHTKQ